MDSEQAPPATIVVTKNGPYVVRGRVPLAVQVIGANAEGESTEWVEGRAFEAGEQYALCRCGCSGHAPFCDGTHAKIGFDGTETADRTAYEARKQVFTGPSLLLEDVRSLCSEARFCDAVKNVWDSMEETGDPAVRERALREVARCPSGRLVIRDRATGTAIEPELPPSIGVVEDPQSKCSGPLWVRGGAIAVQSQDGQPYEVRNRMTLCRCGQSRNKPFCDGSHVEAAYHDGLETAPAA